MNLHFDISEYNDRESKVVKELDKNNLDALLIFRQESMYWLTGYDSFWYVCSQGLIYTKNKEKILLTRAPDLRQAQNTSNIKDIRIWIDQDNANPFEDLKIILQENNLDNKNIGVEYESYGLTGQNALKLNHNKKQMILGF